MIGKSAQMVDDPSTLPPMYNLHKKLFPVLLRLACDVDQVGAGPLDQNQRRNMDHRCGWLVGWLVGSLYE